MALVGGVNEPAGNTSTEVVLGGTTAPTALTVVEITLPVRLSALFDVKGSPVIIIPLAFAVAG